MNQKPSFKFIGAVSPDKKGIGGCIDKSTEQKSLPGMEKQVINDSKLRRILLFGHDGYKNRGCEAIIRTTVKMLNEEFQTVNTTIASRNAKNDRNLALPNVTGYISHAPQFTKWSLLWFIWQINKRLIHKQVAFQSWIQRNVIDHAVHSDVCLSVGGDNYCYSTPYWLYAINRGIKTAGKKLVLWGASIEPSVINKKMEEDLRLFDLIIVRESITYDTLKDRRINPNVFLHPDPAFTLEKEDVPLPVGWMENNMVGINLSPLILRHEKTPGLVLDSFHRLIEHILLNTSSGIALIPHVTFEKNNDMLVLTKLYQMFKDTGRVVLIDPNLTTMQYKALISYCRFFIGARTHATIAAYSFCVPTLVIGYSVKSRGIAKDLFGDDRLVLPVQNLNEEKQLIDAFEELREREIELRTHLLKIMPGYIVNAGEAMKHVRRLFEKSTNKR